MFGLFKKKKKQDDFEAIDMFWSLCIAHGEMLCSKMDEMFQTVTEGEVTIPDNDFSKMEIAFAIMGTTVMILKSSPKMSIERATGIERVVCSKIENIDLPPQYVEYLLNAFNEYRTEYSNSIDQKVNPFGQVAGHMLNRIFEEDIEKLRLPGRNIINPMTHQMVGDLLTMSVTHSLEHWKQN